MSFPKNLHIQHFHLLKVMFTFFKSRPYDYVVFAIISFPTNQHFQHFPLLNLPLQFFQNVSTFRYSYLFQEIRILLLYHILSNSLVQHGLRRGLRFGVGHVLVFLFLRNRVWFGHGLGFGIRNGLEFGHGLGLRVDHGLGFGVGAKHFQKNCY